MKMVDTGGQLTVKCPAKVNLFLEILNRRPDGYHDIETVMQAVTLYDDVTLCRRPGAGIAFRCDDPALPSGLENIAYRAADLVAREVGLPSGVSVELAKRIPVQAGLAGGSSDAAGVLAGLNRLFGLELSVGDLCGLAGRLGSDVAFFIHGGTALCTGRGEIVSPIATDLVAYYVICCPPQRVSTAEAYQNLPRLGLTRGKHSATVVRNPIERGDIRSASANLFNRLEGVAVFLAPSVGRVKKLLAQAASRPALVSGSGSAVYALFESEQPAQQVARHMQQQGVGRIFMVRTEH